MKKQTIIKIILLIAVLITLIWINNKYLNITPTLIREWILSFGLFAPVIYVILYTVRPLILFPASILSLAAGLAFGAVNGTIYTVVGATCGAALSFWVARKLGKNISNKEWTGKAKSIQTQIEKQGFIYVLLLRLLPIFNFDMISYIAGISKVRFKDFVLATFIGIIPGTFAYNFLGSSFAHGDMKIVIIAVIVFLLALIIPIFTSKKLKKRLGLTK
ncbi:TVP38/TMEM64 family protein [Cytobacillus sp. IB215665]|uniref:TVP38/TMEM64 family protein n=1 Tax=Cytobacillus sp. IB215665 TaxID=3097357 RepID=UPI002A14FD6A|nr:TVP38/TMEM64 family protein [Cytobacillus sp. IB215665]MDX8364382.1 TVP38/TMEM64 family protein [Cytobacillus sp. IB215665]